MRNLVVQQLLSGNHGKPVAPVHRLKPVVSASHRSAPFGNEAKLFAVHKRLVVEDQLGVGSTFTIYECTDPVADERVLIKVLTADAGSDAELGFEIEITKLIERGADYGLCFSSRGKTELGPYYAVNGDKETAVSFMLGGTDN